VSTPALTIVMPVCNEEARVAEVVRDWVRELTRLRIDYCLRIYDDGSTDETPRILAELVRSEPRVVATRQENRGHGPTILLGYREARGEWVLQVDGDGELPADAFGALWERRDEYDFLVASRLGRRAPLVRRLVTVASRITVWALFGTGIGDVNSPYRLMRRSRIEPLLAHLPAEPFAPNVLLSGLASRAGLRVYERPVPHRRPSPRRGSLRGARLWRGILRSLGEAFQTLRRARKARFQ
jgi:glycosyltransferase involved in cell wall biosynthesis